MTWTTDDLDDGVGVLVCGRGRSALLFIWSMVVVVFSSYSLLAVHRHTLRSDTVRIQGGGDNLLIFSTEVILLSSLIVI